MTKRYYKTKEHRRWREIVLRRFEYRCARCRRSGVNREATEAHHIYPVAEYPELRLEIKNGVALCRACHNIVEPQTGEYRPPVWMLALAPNPPYLKKQNHTEHGPERGGFSPSAINSGT